MTKELTCVVCPAGCPMTVTLDENGNVVSVTGNTCARGKKYAESEITKQQMANPTVDVFTNKSFEDLKEHPSGNLDLDNIVTINEQALGRLLGMFGGDGESEGEGENAAN